MEEQLPIQNRKAYLGDKEEVYSNIVIDLM